MTPQESVHFAAALPQPNHYEVADTLRDILHALENAATPKVLRAARRELLANAEAFRRTSAPGHELWYPHHLRTAATACARWEKKAQGS